MYVYSNPCLDFYSQAVVNNIYLENCPDIHINSPRVLLFAAVSQEAINNDQGWAIKNHNSATDLLSRLRLVWISPRGCGRWWQAGEGRWGGGHLRALSTSPYLTELPPRRSWQRNTTSFSSFVCIREGVTRETSALCRLNQQAQRSSQRLILVSRRSVPQITADAYQPLKGTPYQRPPAAVIQHPFLTRPSSHSLPLTPPSVISTNMQVFKCGD
ncbi:hypothetical protein E2C01_027922 [Portunus trituberculatus]|uniref:Uncharacterized protein n=1 Tax=Portunus trituberculatus TaxID=210409 RepID=A0A5B7EJ65_PORTR|nr:hypothetical protein [Portunus trituberculatus]